MQKRPTFSPSTFLLLCFCYCVIVIVFFIELLLWYFVTRSVIKVNGGDTEENYLFPTHLLDKLQEENEDKVVNFAMNEYPHIPDHTILWSRCKMICICRAIQVPAIPPLGPGLLLRPLLLSDFNSGFLSLLTQLTSVGDVTWYELLAKGSHRSKNTGIS